VSLGARFDDRVTGVLLDVRPGREDHPRRHRPAEISKNRVADVPIVGDCRETIAELAAVIQVERAQGNGPDLGAWWSLLDTWRETVPARLRHPRRRLAGAAVRHRTARPDRRLRRGLRRRGRPAPDVGRAVHLLREAEHLAQLRRPRHDGLRRARGHGRQGRAPRHHRVGDRR
jgi:thiamine pyrophosphate-dependent acetolactate synthase large subunit-like protein